MTIERKQQQIPGTEMPTIDAIDEAAENFRAVRDERMALTTKEGELRATLLETMIKHGLEKYDYEDPHGKKRRVSINREPKIKVKVVKDDPATETTDDVDVH